MIHVPLQNPTTLRRSVLLNIIHIEHIFPGQENMLSKIAADAEVMPCGLSTTKWAPQLLRNGVITPLRRVKKKQLPIYKGYLQWLYIYIYITPFLTSFFRAHFVKKTWKPSFSDHLCRPQFQTTEIQLELIMHGSPASENVVHTFRVSSLEFFRKEGAQKMRRQTKPKIAGIHKP